MAEHAAPALPWCDDFAVGHDRIDSQHRELVGSINKIGEAVRNGDHEGVATLVQSLRASAADHFREENAILWQIKTGTYKRRSNKALPRPMHGLVSDTMFEAHTADHQSLLARIDEIVRAPLHSIIDELHAWFLDHAVAHDAHLKGVFQAIS